MAEKTPEQKRLNLRHTNAGNGFVSSPLPRAVVEEIPMPKEDLGRVPATERMPRGSTGLGDVVQDSRTRIRTNQQFNNVPSQGDLFKERPVQERMGLSEKSRAALERASKFSANAGQLIPDANKAPKALGGVAGGVLGASTTAMNAAAVYDRTDGDLKKTAQQVAYDLPGAVGGTLGAIAGGVIGRRNPAMSTAGMLAGGAAGTSGGESFAAMADRALGGDGLSPLAAMQQRERSGEPVDHWNSEVPLNPDLYQDAEGAIRRRDNNSRTDEWGNPMAEPEVAQAAPQAAPADAGLPSQDGNPPAQAPVQTPAQATTQPPASPMEAGVQATTPQVDASQDPAQFQRTGVKGVVGRTGANGVPEFSNMPSDVEGATGQYTGGRMGNGLGNLSIAGGSEATQRFNNASAIRGQSNLDRAQANAIHRNRQQMQFNDQRIRGLIQSGKPSDLMQARMLERSNADLSQQINSANGMRGSLYDIDARTALGEAQLGAQNSNMRDYLAAMRYQADQTRLAAENREDFAERDIATADQHLTRALGNENPESGELQLSGDTQRLMAERAPAFMEQYEEQMRNSIAALQQRAESGDVNAIAEFNAAKNDYDRLRSDIYRVGPTGNVVGLRPVNEWPEQMRQTFVDDMKSQQLMQTRRDDSIMPEIVGGLGGAALAGLAGASRNLGTRGRIMSAVAGAGLGMLGGHTVEQNALGTRSAAAAGPNNASAVLPGNVNSQIVEGDNIVATLRDGSVVNLSDFVRTNPDPSFTRKGNDLLPSYGRGGASSQHRAVVSSAFSDAVARSRSSDAATAEQGKVLLQQYANDDVIYSLLSPEQRRLIPRE